MPESVNEIMKYWNNEWMNGCTDIWMTVPMNELKGVLKNYCNIYGWINELLDVWMSSWFTGQKNI